MPHGLATPPDGTGPRVENLDAMPNHFERYRPEHLAADVELPDRVKAATGNPAPYAAR